MANSTLKNIMPVVRSFSDTVASLNANSLVELYIPTDAISGKTRYIMNVYPSSSHINIGSTTMTVDGKVNIWIKNISNNAVTDITITALVIYI